MGTITTIVVGTAVGMFVADVYEKAIAPTVNDLWKSIFGDNTKEDTKKINEK